MARLTPGYDFLVNEVPTREKLLRAARGLSLSGVSSADFAGSVVGIKSGETGSTGYSLPDFGHVWVDPHGNIWVHEAISLVQLYRQLGGWESKRIWVDLNLGAFSRRPGSGICLNKADSIFENIGRLSGATAPGNFVCRVQILEQQQDNDSTVIYHGLITETGASGYRRWCGRGISPLDNGSNASQCFDPLDAYQNDFRTFRTQGPDAAPRQWARQRYFSFAGTVSTETGTFWQGIILAPMPAASQDTSAGVIRYKGPMWCWNYGIMQRGPE